MGILIELPAPDYFGNCPKCGGNDGRMDIGPDYWCLCHKHRFKWWIGSDHLSYRKKPVGDAWKSHIKKLAGYKEVKPLYRFPQKTKLTNVSI